MPKYSIVVPLHNEQENVTDLYDRLKAVMEVNGGSFEIVLVDDGSTDRTFHLLREIAAVDSRVTVGMTQQIFLCFWKKFPRATTSSADGASAASTISGFAASPHTAPTG